MSRLAIYGFVLCILAGGAIAVTALATSNAVPSAQFMSAALNDQEVSSGSLEVIYDYWDRSDPKAYVAEVRYVRTPEISFIRHTMRTFVTTNSFDREQSEFRQLQAYKDGRLNAGIAGNSQGMISSRAVMDPIRYNVGENGLCELVAEGTVAPEQEKIGDFDCWRIDAPTNRSDVEKYVIWLDSSIGFCPRRVEMVRANGKSQVIDFREYKDLGSGVWFPTEIANTFPSIREGVHTYEMVSRVKEVHIGKTFAKDDLRVVFPSGTSVRDYRTDAEYKQP